MRLNYILILTSFCILSSCASLPSASTTLTQEVINEANDMHSLNKSLIQRIFDEKKKQVSFFIDKTYTPAIIKKYEALLPDTLNYRKELPNIIQSIIPVIMQKKDSLLGVIDNQEQKLMSQLDNSYTEYSKAASSLQNLINSAVKIKSTEESILNSVDKLTDNKLNFKKIASNLDSILNKSSSFFSKLDTIENTLK
ncbi:conserved exported protein of unknown function [Tenacibaculum sp. 190130A14a]|uniref:Lipoprotein n=1 Tax=Tenacibaculum polynesiense TaxID=3137857 RepID=A0ABM9PF91_9FLAO